jgi:hypothetical protein
MRFRVPSRSCTDSDCCAELSASIKASILDKKQHLMVNSHSTNTIALTGRSRPNSLPPFRNGPDSCTLKENVGQALAKHTRNLVPWILRREAIRIMKEDDAAVFRKMVPEYRDTVPGDVLLQALLLAPFWIRAPRTWVSPGADMQSAISLLKHLFERYPIPDFLYNACIMDPPNGWRESGNFKWLCWIILLGQGESLHRFSQFYYWTVTKSFAAYLSRVPSGLHPLHACMWIEIK